MFWSDQQQTYELPYSERQESPQLSKSATPKATAKQMRTAAETPLSPSLHGIQAASTPSLTTFPCPVCGKLLELYEYTKGNEQKQMFRCSGPVKETTR